MTPAQKRLKELRERQSKERQRMAELSLAAELTDETRSELDTIEAGTPDLERLLRAAQVAVDTEEAEQRTEQRDAAPDGEDREKIELRGKASLHRIFACAVAGKRLNGAEEEYRQAVHCAEREIPFDIFEAEPQTERRTDATTAAPSVVGVNMTGIVPAVFARSIAGQIGLAMPRAPSGKYSIPRFTTNLTAAATTKGQKRESTAAVHTVESAGPRRISARMSTTAEDRAEVGIPGWSASLRLNLQMVLAEALDLQIISGDGTAPNIKGLFARFAADDLNKVDADPAEIVTFPSFVADMAGLLDGVWATRLSAIRLATNETVMAKLAALFQEPRFVDKGTGGTDNASGVGSQSVMTAADWGEEKLGGLWCNGRMPDNSNSNIGNCIAVRSGMMTDPAGAAMMPASLPTWGNIGITDPYTDSGSAIEHVTLHVLIGDQVLVRHPDAFQEVRFKTA